MKHSPIRDFRRRLGWTQWDLAEKLNVDQGTVSRWERGVESPRPATAGALRELILREDDRRAIERRKAMVEHSLQPACLVDKNARLQNINHRAIAKSCRDHRIDLSNHVGLEWERHAEVVSMQQAWEVFRDSRFLKGDVLLARFYANLRGRGHVTQYEPIFEMGELAGFTGVVVGTFDLPDNSDKSLERAEVVYADAPDELVDIYVGGLVEHTRLA